MQVKSLPQCLTHCKCSVIGNCLCYEVVYVACCHRYLRGVVRFCNHIFHCKLLHLEVISKLQNCCKKKNGTENTYFYHYSSFVHALSVYKLFSFSELFEDKLHNLWPIIPICFSVYVIRIGVFFSLTAIVLSTSVNLILAQFCYLILHSTFVNWPNNVLYGIIPPPIQIQDSIRYVFNYHVSLISFDLGTFPVFVFYDMDIFEEYKPVSPTPNPLCVFFSTPFLLWDLFSHD